MSADFPGGERQVALTLFTDSFVVRGYVRTRERRVTDILNHAEHNFVVLMDVVLDEYGSRAGANRSDYAQINLGSVLFAVTEGGTADAVPEMHTPKIPEQALISIPPFKILGHIHLKPDRNLRDALEELTGRFVPVTNVTYWSDTAGEARTSAAMIAVNHSRAQVFAPHREVDPWAGLARSAAAEAATNAPHAQTGVQDPWGIGRSGAAAAPAAEPNPWGPGVAQPGRAQNPWRDPPSGRSGDGR
ncbi:MAG TPA: hypothetical protein VH723_09220 [Candidatus Limnocylindrales bacterium]|jgi:hypothetical protein